MNLLRSAPWLLLVGVVSTGCPPKADTKPDAAAPVGSVAALEGRPQKGGGPLPDQPGAPDAGPATTGTPDGGASAEADCVDRWLESKGLDRYGSPKGTMYMGGTPLFDERTGERTDRLDFVYRRHAEARAACQPDGGAPREPAAE